MTSITQKLQKMGFEYEILVITDDKENPLELIIEENYTNKNNNTISIQALNDPEPGILGKSRFLPLYRVVKKESNDVPLSSKYMNYLKAERLAYMMATRLKN